MHEVNSQWFFQQLETSIDQQIGLWMVAIFISKHMEASLETLKFIWLYLK